MSGATVGLDQLAAPVPGGIGRYTLNITRALAKRSDSPYPLVGFLPRISREKADSVHGKLPLLDSIEISPYPRRVLALAWKSGFLLPKIETSYSPNLFAPLGPDGRQIVTVHDTVPWTHPETLTKHGAKWHREMGERAAQYADTIIVPTEAVAERLGAILKADKRIEVIGGAPDPELKVPFDEIFRRKNLGIPDKYLTFVGTLEPRKGLPKLIEAISRLGNTNLVIVGPQGWGRVSVADLAAKSGIDSNRIHAVGSVDDQTLASILSASTGLIVPSIDEGFGLPVLEAMSLGVPVIHSTAPALVEVAGNAGIVVDVHGNRGVEQLAEAIAGLEDQKLQKELIALGRSRAAEFTWDASAEKLSALIGGRKPPRPKPTGAPRGKRTN